MDSVFAFELLAPMQDLIFFDPNTPVFIPKKHPKMNYRQQKRNAIKRNNKRKFNKK